MRFLRKWACTYKMTRFSSEIQPTLLNLLANYNLDIVLSSDGMVWYADELSNLHIYQY